MVKPTPQNVDEYLKVVEPDARQSLGYLRKMILETVPEAGETMHYQMPTYEIGKPLCSFAAQKRYLAFYINDKEIMEQFRARFVGLNLGKGCVRFRKFDQLPDRAVRAMLRMGARQLLKEGGQAAVR